MRIEGNRSLRFDLVTHAHRFVLEVLPFRRPESEHALERFAHAASRCDLPSAELRAVLLECLSVLDRHTGGRLPGLVATYLDRRHRSADDVATFRQCVDDVLKYRAIGSPLVQQAIAALEDGFGDPHLRQGTLAALLNVGSSQLCAMFKAHTGLTFSEYLENLRLNHAATLLTTTALSIKEVWTQVGYNHHSNFDHSFKQRFGATPREYRTRAIQPAATAQCRERHGTNRAHDPGRPETRGVILLVDDDEGTRETVGRYFRWVGYSVAVASTGDEALREAARLAPSAVLLDYHLPDTDGLECLRAMRLRVPTTPRTVVIFTADWEVEDRRDELVALGGMVASKLCDLEEIERIVAWTQQSGG